MLGAGASHAQETSAPAAGATAKIESPIPAGVESPALTPVDSSSTANADSSAVAGIDEAPAPASKAAETAAAPTPAKTVDIKDFGEQTVCENLTIPGSRIVREKRCYTTNPNDRSEARRAELRKEATQLQVRQLRREQEDWERMERDREMARQRAIMSIAAQQ